MEQEQVLKARIASLTELRGLFQALRVLAASRLQEAQAALTGIRAYSGIITEALADALALVDASEPQVEGQGGVLVVICAEHGFVGGFNARLLDIARESLGKGEVLIVLGKRGGMVAGERGLAPDRIVPMATHVAGVQETAHEIAEALAPHATARAIFGRYQKGGGFEPAERRLLPPDLPPPSVSLRPAPLAQLAPSALLAQLDREYLFAALSQALMDSFACENAARLRVMESADHAIADKLLALNRAENDLRQESITAELLDVVTGAEAVLR